MSVRFKVVIPVWNARRWIARSIMSVIFQTYQDWRLVIVDDASTDGTGRIIERFKLWDRITLIRRGERIGALANIALGIEALTVNDDEVIVTVDGDDWLADEKVFARLAEVYESGEVQMTYGQFRDTQGNLGWAKAYDKHIIENRRYRFFGMLATHLRTFRRKLWKNIRRQDLLDPQTGKPWEMAWDVAFMVPMLEMCRPEQIRCMAPEVLYIYNMNNPQSDHVKDRAKQKDCDDRIRALPKYEVLA